MTGPAGPGGGTVNALGLQIMATLWGIRSPEVKLQLLEDGQGPITQLRFTVTAINAQGDIVAVGEATQDMSGRAVAP